MANEAKECKHSFSLFVVLFFVLVGWEILQEKIGRISLKFIMDELLPHNPYYVVSMNGMRGGADRSYG